MNKPILYILHGWAYTTEKWKPLCNQLKQQGYVVKLLKIPGLTAPLPAVWHLADYVNWLAEQISDKQPIVLLGHSNGGRIAISFAALHPEKVSHLILIDSAGIYHQEAPLRLKRFAFKTTAKIGRKIIKSAFIRKVLYKLAREHDYEQAEGLVMRQTMTNLLVTDLRAKMPSISVPTLIIWGEQDKTTPLTDGKIIHRLIPHSQLHIIPQARHSPQFTHPEEVVEIIKQSLKT